MDSNIKPTEAMRREARAWVRRQGGELHDIGNLDYVAEYAHAAGYAQAVADVAAWLEGHRLQVETTAPVRIGPCTNDVMAEIAAMLRRGEMDLCNCTT